MYCILSLSLSLSLSPTCREYNAPDTIYCKLANKLEAIFNHSLASHLVFE